MACYNFKMVGFKNGNGLVAPQMKARFRGTFLVFTKELMLPASLGQFPHMRCHRTGKTTQIIPTLQDGNKAALAVFIGGLDEQAGQLGEVVIGEFEPAEGVVDAGVETGGDEDEVGFETGDFGL